MRKYDNSLQNRVSLIKRDKKRPWRIELLIKNAASLLHVAQLVPLPDITPNPSGRKKRSEFEVSLSRFLQALFLYTDLESLRVGVPNQKFEFYNASLDFIAKAAGIHISSAKRVYSALCNAGYIEASKQVKKLKNGAFHCYIVVKRVSLSLLNELGLTHAMYAEYKDGKRKEQEKSLVGKGAAFAEKLFQKIKKKTRKIIKKGKAASEIRLEQQLQQEALSLHQKYPNLSPSEHYKALKVALEKPPP